GNHLGIIVADFCKAIAGTNFGWNGQWKQNSLVAWQLQLNPRNQSCVKATRLHAFPERNSRHSAQRRELTQIWRNPGLDLVQKRSGNKEWARSPIQPGGHSCNLSDTHPCLFEQLFKLYLGRRKSGERMRIWRRWRSP